MARWQDYILQGVRADQPLATAVSIGTLYGVTDESDIIERSDGSAWVAYSPTGADSLVPSTNGFRLTLSSGNPLYAPQSATPASTDTGAETVTFAANTGWTNGTIVTVSATASGLTTGVVYYLHVVTASTVFSFHTTVATALSGASPVNLTGNVTAVVTPSGVSNTTVYLSPYTGTKIALYDGAAWDNLTSAEVSVALGTLTSGLPYDVFAYDSSGTLTLELLAWTSTVARATAIVQQDGVWVKSGVTTRRLVGTILTNSTTTTIDDAGGLASQTGGKRFVSNASNVVPVFMTVFDGTSNWTYSTATWRQADGNAGNQVEAVLTLPYLVDATLVSEVYLDTSSNARAFNGINFDSTTATPTPSVSPIAYASAYEGSNTVRKQGMLKVGYHAIVWMESGSGTAQSIFVGTQTSLQSALNAVVWS